MEGMEKRELILQAAARAFGTKGFHDSRVSEIAAEAGVAKGTVYLYFKDKETLLHEVLHFYYERYTKELHAQVDQYVGARDKLLGLIRFHLAQFPQMVKFHKMNMEQLTKFQRDPNSKDRMKGEQQRNLRFIEGILQLGIDEGVFRSFNVEHAAVVCWGAMHANVHWAMVSGQEEIDIDIAESTVELLINGFGV